METYRPKLNVPTQALSSVLEAYKPGLPQRYNAIQALPNTLALIAPFLVCGLVA